MKITRVEAIHLRLPVVTTACDGTQDDLIADMDEIRAFYHGVRGLRPERQGPVRVAGEGGEV